MYRTSLDLSHRPERDGSVSASSHAPFYLPPEMAMWAWIAALDSTGLDSLAASNFAVLRLEADYRFEMHVGPAEFEVAVGKVGRTSVTFVVTMHQGGRSTGTFTFVLVRVDGTRSQSTALTEEQRSSLTSL